MLTVLLVKSKTNVSIASNVAIQLVRFGGETTSLTPTNGTIHVELARGIYKFISSASHTIMPPEVEGVTVSGKDKPTDPTLKGKLKAIVPDASDDALRQYLVEPGSKAKEKPAPMAAR